MPYYMDAIIMPSINLLIHKLRADFPQFNFASGDAFHWSPQDSTIYYPENSSDVSSLLHELAHAILEHRQYSRDIELIQFEQAAWHHAKEVLGLHYGVAIDPDHIEDALDTYREWLHARSTCPHCQATGLQIQHRIYSCFVCRTKWRVNDARVCGLRRFVIETK